MCNTLIKPFVRPCLAVIALAMSVSAGAGDNKIVDPQNPAASFFDQLLSPPAPLLGATLFDQTMQGAHSRHTITPEQQALMQSVTGFVSGLASHPDTQAHSRFFNGTDAVAASADGNRPLGQWLMNAARHAGSNVQIGARMPLDVATQSPTDTVTRAINSREATQYLEQNSDVVTLLARLLGWQQTGLLPSVADLQKMASSHVGAVSSSIESWALQNVSFSSSALAVTSADDEQSMLQWHWTITANNNQHNNHSIANNENNFSANLRRLFGMNDYY